MGKRKKDEGAAAAKGQAIIPSFFKRGETDASRAPTLVWPSPHHLRRSAENAASASKKRCLNLDVDAGSGDGKDADCGVSGEAIKDRRRKFVDVLLGEGDRDGGGGNSSFYGKPPSGKEKLTPLEQQIVELKKKFPDILLMVEVGYKFRFFGEDAEKAANVLGIVAYYSHNFLTASVPTFRLHVHVRRLVEAGYKVGVVKQTETAAIKAHGTNKAGPFSRDLSALYTKATLEAGEFLGGEESGERDGPIRLSSYIMCVVEEAITEHKANAGKDEVRGSFDARFGVVAVETSTGDVMYGHFLDTVTRTELESRLLACAPAELLLSASLSASTKKLLMDYAGAADVRVEKTPENSFENGGTVAALADFYGSLASSKKGCLDEKVDAGLEALMTMPEIVVAAFAHIFAYLKQFNLENVLRLGALFRPFAGQQEMTLSPNTIRQLEILHNQTDGTENGYLFWLMNHTKTAFGARLLKYWVTHPLRDRMLISQRLDAVAEIAESIGDKGRGTTVATLASTLLLLGKLPDLERGITRIYHKTATTYEFINVINAIMKAASQFQRVRDARSALLSRLISAVTSTSVIDHANKLVTSLNAEAAAAGDKINLFVAGQFPEVDECKETIKSIEKDLESFLPSYRELLKCSNLEYLSVSGTSFLVEVLSFSQFSYLIAKNWVKINSTKKANRYHPPEVLEASERMALAKEQLNISCAKAWDMFLTDFTSYHMEFRAAVQALAALDCLYSLAVVSCNQGYVRPEFVDEACLLKIGHPVLDSTLQDAFVPNDTVVSGEGERSQIITGPKMGGKSCYIGQVALITIMSQIGLYVPAATAKLHVFDAVFTRMGAMDRIQRGSSTFFEELSEASTILHKATSRSLVVIDELGRGTSTHDGITIAYAMLHHLLQEVHTHYLNVTEVVKLFPSQVQAYHMSYLVESLEGDLDKSSVQEVVQKVTFLYKL
ncbi:DNA mismatch repair protein MSH3 [Selaginella moellendorffii]|uniref:DNA mismatch repair protein MSH3 n=1 Tax=Selaginella moellendorffii TaxID=88036 RepID=UPI000D1C4CD5|nr:DNA mismatch repair protein MSH3 [Selaginella moellendorffii]|eukprot:XP_024542217.1 DNA mismatch repair protein MSH3 [Selaginella moellendorffii]